MRLLRLILLLLLIAGLVVFMPPPPAPGAEPPVEDPVDTLSDVPSRARLTLVKARKARGQGDHGKSVSVLEKLLVDHPQEDHFLVRFQLGRSLVLADRAADAVDHFARATEMEPRYAPAWLNLGQTAYESGRYALAGRALRESHRRDRNAGVDLLYFAAASYLLAEQADPAAGILEELVSGAHGPARLDWYRALIAACVDLEDAARGRRAADGLLRDFPASPEAWHLAFQHAAATEDYRGAAVALTVVGYLRPLEDRERVQLGDIYRAIGVPAAAGELYATAARDTGDAFAYERLASAWIAAHEPEKALATLREAVDRAPSPRLWSLLGDLLAVQEAWDRAYEAFATSVDLDPERGRAWLMMGYCALELERYDDAREALTAATDHPEQADGAATLLRQLAARAP